MNNFSNERRFREEQLDPDNDSAGARFLVRVVVLLHSIQIQPVIPIIRGRR